MSKKSFNPEFNKGFGIKSVPLAETPAPSKKLRRTKAEAKMIIIITAGRPAHIWDTAPQSYRLRGRCVVRNLRGYEIYDIWTDERVYQVTEFFEQKLAEMFPLVWDIDLEQPQIDDIPF